MPNDAILPVELPPDWADGLTPWLDGVADTDEGARETEATAQEGADVRAAWAAQWQTLYPELRRVAARLMSRERSGHTLSPTALVNEAWLALGSRLAAGDGPLREKHHFLALATRAMRHILVNHAQARMALKRRGQAVHETLSAAEAEAQSFTDPADIVALDQALRAFAQEDARAAQVAELKCFGGLEVAEIAQALGVSEPTVKRDWVFARARLAQLLVT